MESNSLPTQVILSSSLSTLSHLHLNWEPQPGAYLEVEGKTYMVLERRHRYRLKSGRYELRRIAIYVQPFQSPDEPSLLEGRWVIGDIDCAYNARSEVLRCAINPSGPCDRCPHFQPLEHCS
jgi:Family of unknown function (DUF6464)